MAAQERAKQVQAPPEQQQPVSAPPAFDDSFLPPPPIEDTFSPPPPPFEDSMFLAPPPPQQQQAPTMTWDPHAPTAPSAPEFSDLLAMEAPLPPPVQHAPTPDESAVEAILGIPGLSDEERSALLDEQVKIMASIEKNRKSAAHTAADAFEQRSFATNVRSIQLGSGQGGRVVGQEASRQAIKDGTAISVQCVACQHWMQVTQDAVLMNCPVCSTVQPVCGTREEAAQLQSDMELAEQLQKEEYEEQSREERREGRHAQQATAAAAAKEKEAAGGWMEWLGMGGTATTAVATSPPAPERPSPRGTEPSLWAESNHEPVSGRVAVPQPMFSCVTDSISTALHTAMAAPPPEGVDSSSLLAMPQVGRNQNHEQDNDRSPNY
jgi:hypothetical protein